MADALQDCCQRARALYIKRIIDNAMSYPVIKEIPCPTCRRIIPIRLYLPPSESGETA